MKKLLLVLTVLSILVGAIDFSCFADEPFFDPILGRLRILKTPEETQTAKADLYMVSWAPSNTITPGTPVLLTANSSMTGGGLPVKDFSPTTDGHFTYLGTDPIPVLVTATIGIRASESNFSGAVKLGKNGVIIHESFQTLSFETAGRTENVVLEWVLIMEQNDYIGIYADSTKSTTMSALSMYFKVMQIE